ncbi:MAG: hypothetical protein L0L40_03030, partial [Lactobacillus sp.]|nr:hypothetical protein [Lactobacillus sp.]
FDYSIDRSNTTLYCFKTTFRNRKGIWYSIFHFATDIINPQDQITLIGSNEAVQKIGEILQEDK